jgi:hypothetical protein
MIKGGKYHTNRITSRPSSARTFLISFLTNALEDVLFWAPLSRGAYHKTKPAALLDYKYSV